MEKEIMELISAAGDSRAKAFEALKQVRLKNYEEAKKLIEESRASDLGAHNIQTQLIQQELNGENKVEMNLLMVHAQDHYMTSQLVRDLIEELIKVFEERDGGNDE
ncbi:PTS lactose/cellobiose transporter subunit IIA [Enterococcus camelliae]|uniref:PTS lactose/cellobiose transporter subunit IIA n=1 Tax=Enterococcus camelliae TaxID=453959 RepID=A0ABW5TJD2_9ENTE